MRIFLFFITIISSFICSANNPDRKTIDTLNVNTLAGDSTKILASDSTDKDEAILVLDSVANQELQQPIIPTSLLDSLFCLPTGYDTSLEHLLHGWLEEKKMLELCDLDSLTPIKFSDSVYMDRLKRLPHIMPMPYNAIVGRLINFYASRPKQVSYMLGLGQSYYFAIFENALQRYNIPLEMRYLPIIESALNAKALSRVGAGGLWQFMVSTGRLYGLEVNSLVDERCNPYKSSEAAARYLTDLYKIYKDWHLVIAAYNCGPGNVAKAIRRSGGKRGYWDIYPHLPKETRSYVPIFIAANYIMTYHNEHNICAAQPKLNMVVDTIVIRDRVHLAQISEVLQIPIEEIRFFNPQYRKDIIPGDYKPYPLVLPLNLINAYEEMRDTIILHRKQELVSVQEVVKPVEATVKYYKVKSGDNLGAIAAKHKTTVAQLKKWNNIKGTMIKIGQRLRVG